MKGHSALLVKLFKRSYGRTHMRAAVVEAK